MPGDDNFNAFAVGEPQSDKGEWEVKFSKWPERKEDWGFDDDRIWSILHESQRIKQQRSPGGGDGADGAHGHQHSHTHFVVEGDGLPGLKIGPQGTPFNDFNDCNHWNVRFLHDTNTNTPHDTNTHARRPPTVSHI